MNTLQLITHTNWMVEELRASQSWDVRHSYGLDIPNYSPTDAWWMPQALYVRLQRSIQECPLLTPLQFLAPPSDLLERTVPSLVGRAVRTCTLDELRRNPQDFTSGWWKFASAKEEEFPAEYRGVPEVLEIAERLLFPGDSILQWSEGLNNLHSEYRFFINSQENGERYIAAETGYLSEGNHVYEGAQFNAKLTRLAQETVAELLEQENGSLLPPAFVVDVAVLDDFNPRAVILEYNPAWCSGWYNANIEGVLGAVNRSTNPTECEMEDFAYVPDVSLVAKYGKQRLLRSF